MAHIRKNVWELGEDWADPILWYARGVKAMKARALNEPTGWRFYGAIHGIDKGLWQQLPNGSRAPPRWGGVCEVFVVSGNRLTGDGISSGLDEALKLNSSLRRRERQGRAGLNAVFPAPTGMGVLPRTPTCMLKWKKTDYALQTTKRRALILLETGAARISALRFLISLGACLALL